MKVSAQTQPHCDFIILALSSLKDWFPLKILREFHVTENSSYVLITQVMLHEISKHLRKDNHEKFKQQNLRYKDKWYSF